MMTLPDTVHKSPKPCPNCSSVMEHTEGKHYLSNDPNLPIEERPYIENDAYFCKRCMWVEVYTKGGKLIFASFARAE